MTSHLYLNNIELQFLAYYALFSIENNVKHYLSILELLVIMV